ncbi:autotransporter outer membrane beta-barrel domain-containing protein [Avibacterium avium]|uniref:autotransporter outer membrane beta-barrel domain-containing protein n=1 Tax=Avibacterium avium TaxID=751 RepID=UPI003BF7D292
MWALNKPNSKKKFSNYVSFTLSPLSIILLNLFSTAYAACPTPAPAVVQDGGICTYDGDNFQDGGRGNAVIDIQNGGTATFTSPEVTLHNTTNHSMNNPSSHKAPYAIHLGDRFKGSERNKAIFEGNVTILDNPSNNNNNYTHPTFDITLYYGGDLHIKGNLTVTNESYPTYSHASGVIFDLWDGTMKIDGKVTATTRQTDFLDARGGNYSFNGDVELNSISGGIFASGGISASSYNSDSIVNFNGNTKLNYTAIPNDRGSLPTMFVRVSDATLNFNNLTANISGGELDMGVFHLSHNGIINFRGDTTISAPESDAIVLNGDNATLTNNGTLSVTSKDGIAIHVYNNSYRKNRKFFFNEQNGVLSTEKTAIHNAVYWNDGEYNELVINNKGLLSASDDVIFANGGEYRENTLITATNTGTLKGYLRDNFLDNDGKITLDNQGTGLWQVTKDSTISTLTNTGTIQFSPTNTTPTTLSVDSYTGGGKLLVNTTWNDDANDPLNGSSISDLLKINTINGSAVTTVAINAASLGNITQKDQEIFSTNVVEVANDHNGNLFVGKAATDSGAEAQLKREGNNYRWTLTAKTPTDEVLIVSKPIVGYVQMPYINQQMGLSQLGQLHKRVGEQNETLLNYGNHGSQIWGRMYMDTQNLQGKNRFGSKVHSGFIQFGKDFAFNANNNASSHTGMMVTYGWANSKFYDKYRAENGVVIADKFTGKAHTDMLSVGGYHTYYSPSHFYIDMVGQLSWLQNHYKSEQTAKQNGHGVAVSVEVGKSFKLGNSNFALEPQAQLTYQWLNLQNIHDDIHSVKVKDQHNLTARVGSRLTYRSDIESSAKFNISANLIQTLAGKTSKIKLGEQEFNEKFSDLAFEVGLGADFPLTQNLNLYADIRYAQSIGDRNRIFSSDSLGKSSYNFSLGARYIW